MTIRRRKLTRRLRRELRNRANRRLSSLHVERLEERQLLATGPQLIAIQPNRGDLLLEGQVRTEAPRELVFRFQESANIDPSTLPEGDTASRYDSIQVWRSGQDGEFEVAHARTDFGTNGAVVVQFLAQQVGQGGNFVELTFTQATEAQAPPVAVDVVGKQITLELNPARAVTAQTVVDAINAHPSASSLVQASVVAGIPTTNIAGVPVEDYSPVRLHAANAANATTDFGYNQVLSVEFAAVTPGPDGNGTRVVLDGEDLGPDRAAPRISVDGKTVQITMNTNTSATTTVADLVAAVNSDPVASGVVEVRVPVGDQTLPIGTRGGRTLVLIGGDDERVVPGFVGLGRNDREVTMRFREALVDDLYLINVFGTGPAPLLDTSGNPFQDGSDFTRFFTLDLGPQVLSVVPQPVERMADGSLVQARNQIDVYFNSDPLDPALATDPRFYRLIFTAETATNQDDVVFFPDQIDYDPQTGIASLSFAAPLEQLVDPVTGRRGAPGTYRLRIGTDEALPVAPKVVDVDGALNVEPGSSFETALALDQGLWNAGSVLNVFGDSRWFDEGQQFQITDTQGNRGLFEFDTGFVVTVPAAGGDGSQGGILDGETLTIGNGTTSVTFEFDSDGSTAPANTSIPFSQTDTAAAIAAAVATAVQNAGLELSPVILPGGRVYLGGTPSHSLDTSNTRLTQSGRPGAQTAGAIAVPFVPGGAMDAAALATAITDAINGSGIGVTASTEGSHIQLSGATDVVLLSSFPAMELSTQGIVLQSQIVNPTPFPLDFPGATDEPGHRDIPPQIETHLNADVDSHDGPEVYYYNFQDEYGVLEGRVMHNAITEAQKQRAREVFEFYSSVLGVQFIESENRGFTIVTGDLRVLDPNIDTGPGGVAGLAGGNMAIMDAADFDNADDSRPLGSWFQVAMHEIGHLLGLGHSYELPPLTIQGDQPQLSFGIPAEGVFPGDHDIAHGQFLHRPDSTDIDLYRFEVTQSGEFQAETVAERLVNSSLLDTYVVLYRVNLDADGRVIEREVVAQNDDFFANDSYIRVQLEPGTYYLAVSSTGNDAFDPQLPDTGLGGRTSGRYELRMNFRPNVDDTIRDATGVAFDGDGDGIPGGVYNFWFRTAAPEGTQGLNEPSTLFVDKAAADGGDGSPQAPFNNIQEALAAAEPGDIVRIVPNGGADGDLTTTGDNLAYEIGFRRFGNTPLQDGESLEVPKGVTVVVDAGVIMKLRRARIGVGSSSVSIDRSNGALQVLGTPRVIGPRGEVVLDETGRPAVGSVYFTSVHDPDLGVGALVDPTAPGPRPGDWGGIVFRNDIDLGEQRYVPEQNGLFVNRVTYGDFRYGGGSVLVSGVSQVVTPIHLIDARPDLMYNRIRFSADAAISANPDSFEETTYNAPRFQNPDVYSSDYRRVGPEIRGNTVVENSLNGLFIRVTTPAGQDIEKMTVSGRWDERDIPIILTEALILRGQPGGPLDQAITPPSLLIKGTEQTGGTLSAGTYNYRVTFVNAAGEETPASEPSADITVTGAGGAIFLENLPTLHNVSGFVSRRLYRSNNSGGGRYTLVANLNAFDTSYVDDGGSLGELLKTPQPILNGRPSARLAIDPGVVVKVDAGRFEAEAGATFAAEGTSNEPVVFTSLADRRYGAGGTFDTASSGRTDIPERGDWAGLFFGHLSSASLDNTVIAYAGGVTRIEGRFAGFNPVEIHQAETRIARTRFEFNANGVAEGDVGGSLAPAHRFGRGSNGEATIFVRGAQPIIVDNELINNEGAAISINVNALNSRLVSDRGRMTGAAEILVDAPQNQGPLVRGNRMFKDVTDQRNLEYDTIHGMVVRPGTLTTQGVWDDTDIVHVVLDTITVPDLHTRGGLRLESSATESLVVKLLGPNAGFTATGRALDIENRIGGSVQIVGQPRSPVVLTSLNDDTVGAGFTPDGDPMNDTNANGDRLGRAKLPTGPEVDNGTLIDNDVLPNIPGRWLFDVLNGGESGSRGGITAQGRTQLFSDVDVIFDFLNFIDVGANGSAFDLGSTTITQPATLVAPDLVVSEGSFNGQNGTVNWRLETTLEDGIPTVFNKLILTSEQPLGTLRFINYLDEDVLNIDDDFLYLVGTPGQEDFRAFTLDNAERIGFSQGGIYTAGPGLENATYDGFAADKFADLLSAIQGSGTTYSPAGNIDTTDLTPMNDPELGQIYGLADVTTAFAWSVDPNATSATITSFLDLVPRDPATDASAGDWRSVRIDPLANDRNVDIVLEREATDAQLGVDANPTPASAQPIGLIAPHDKAQDENLRLGVEVQGVIASPSDVDVYSFEAFPGTEVWFDIDRTSQGLDSVVELIDANGHILAQSDDSFAEGVGRLPVYVDTTQINATDVHPLQRSASDFYPESAFGQPKDEYSTNPRDAGFRVRLPGPSGEKQTYYVRVRSSNLLPGDNRAKLQDPNAVFDGLTRGAYQLQVRIQERDEVPGSTVQFADIRYATNAVEVFGQPTHSPLAAEALEDGTPNQVLADAQPLGNFMQTDRGALGFSGTLDNPTDVDFYQFEARYDSIQRINSAGDEHVPVVFDIDYTDGLGRPDTQLWVFDDQGNLIFTGERSNLADDLPAPKEGNDLDDLDRGSVGQLDPFIGPVALPGGSYSVAVTNAGLMNREMEQFYLRNPANPLFRLEPIDSVGRIYDEHFNTEGAETGTADPPQIPVLLNNDAIVPYALGDISLYVATQNNFSVEIYSVDGFTGVREYTVGNVPVPEQGLIEDIAVRPTDDSVRAFSTMLHNLARTRDDRVGIYIGIDPGDASVTDQADDQLETYEPDPGSQPPCTRDRRARNPVSGENNGVGIHFRGVTFGTVDGRLRGFAVGSRPEPFRRTECGTEYEPNALYWFDPDTGQMETVAFQPGVQDRVAPTRHPGAGTQVRERGVLDTGDPNDPGNSTLATTEATTVDTAGRTIFRIRDGAQVGVDFDFDGTADVTFEMNTGPEVLLQPDAAAGRFVRDGDTFLLDGTSIEFDTGSVLVVRALSGAEIADGETFTITDDNPTGEVTLTFEFNKTGGVSGSNIEVPIHDGMTQTQIIQSMRNAIDGASFRVQTDLVDNRITLINESSTTGATSNAPTVAVEGSPGSTSPRVVRVEETMDRDEFGTALVEGFRSIAGVTVGWKGERVNFLGATTGDFTTIVGRGVFVDVGSDGNVSPGTIGVGFLAQDSADLIASRLANAMTGQSIPNRRDNNLIFLNPPFSYAFASSPFTLGGNPPGGELTGLAFVGQTLYAISDEGGLYQIDNYASTQGAVARYIPTSVALRGLEFEGLVAGPTTTENGAYSDILFGVTSDGTLYAFNTQGILQPVFLDGRSSIDLDVEGRVVGLAFSTLQENPWRVVSGTNFQSDDPGHFEIAPPDASRPALQFNNTNGSLHMARGELDPTGYAYTGGLMGAIETAPFSLAEYSPADRPYLYFTYFSETEDANGPTVWDSMRVYITDGSGQWDLLATNNENVDLEAATSPNFVQPIFDNTGSWRQVRVPLTNYAGLDNLQLRFDFTTAGDWNYGDIFTTGSDLRIRPGRELRDGEFFQVDNRVFEIELGLTLVTPSGKAIADGSTLELRDGFNTYVLEFDSNAQLDDPAHIRVPFGEDWTPREVAESLFSELRNNYVTPVLSADLTDESNDSLADAVDSGLIGTQQSFVARGEIGDNPNVEPDLDVDLVKVELKQNGTLRANVRAFGLNPRSDLDPVLRVFDARGREVAFNDNSNSTPDPSLTFTATEAGTYYVGVSGAPNTTYDPRFASSGLRSQTLGEYELSIEVTDPAGVALVDENRVNVAPIISAVADPASNVAVEGDFGTRFGEPIFINGGMSDRDVARAVRRSLANAFANGVIGAFKTRGNVVRVIGHTVDDPGPFGLTDSLPGDAFGNFNSPRRSQLNMFEGIYIDDIIIGFAERGEMATGAAGISDFVNTLDQETVNPILVGEYYGEIRTTDLFGTTTLDENDNRIIDLTETYDTNFRNNQSLAIVAPPAYDLSDGYLLRLSDGTGEVVYEFDDVTINDGVAPGHVEVDFDPLAPNPFGPGLLAERDFDIAKRLRESINSDASRNVIDVSAGLSNSAPAGSAFDAVSRDPILNLHGSARTDVIVDRLEITETTTDARKLAERLIGPGIQLGSMTPNLVSGVNSAGFFENGSRSLGIEEGVILATGDARTAEGPNVDSGSTTTASGLPDPDLDRYFAVETFDTTSLEFSIVVPQDGTISFDFVFASEEYNEFVNSQFNDAFAIFVDGENIAFVPNTQVPVSVNTINAGNPFGSGGPNQQYYRNNAPEDDGLFLEQIGFDGFTTVLSATPFLTAGEHTVKIAIGDVADTLLDSAVFLRPINAQPVRRREGLPGIVYDGKGDDNRKRDQGQIVIHSNRITQSLERGVRIDAGARDANTEIPHNGPARLTRLLNERNLLPGVVVSNNVVAFNGDAGIEYSGDPSVAPMQTAPVPFGRIVNNTVVGIPGRTTGIRVTENASPTLMNNIVADHAVGIQVDGTSTTTVIGATLYAGNGIDTVGVGPGEFPISVADSSTVFVNGDEGNFYLRELAPAIDSSMDSLRDRPEMKLLREPLGIAESPILAPSFDSLGQLRVDDPAVSTPSGLGGNVFVDRGAIDRADFAGPVAEATNPRDNDASGLDLDPRETFIQRADKIFEAFEIRLVDGVAPSNAALGVGIDDLSVLTDTVVVSRDGRVLEEGIDYLFSYNATSDTIRLTPTAGIWEGDSAYEITLTNTDSWLVSLLDGSQVADGATIDVTDGFGNTVTFEFDSGYSLQVPSEGGAAFQDGVSFQIANGGTRVTFEFDNDGTTFGGTPVPFTGTDSAAQIGEAIANAINGNPQLGLNAVHVGDGFVQLGGTSDHTISVGSTPLVLNGAPGVSAGNVPILYVAHPSTSGAELAANVAAAINANTQLQRVRASAQGSNVSIVGAEVVRGDRVRFVGAIRDLAGNALLPNRDDGTTAFTVFLGAALDLGDAPASYPVAKANDGAAHRVVPGYSLGANITSESDGQPSQLANADDGDDGVTFSRLIAGYDATATVVATGVGTIAPGFLDAWIDFNGDGDWNDSGEKIFDRVALADGVNTLTFRVEAFPPNGVSYARFRLSSTGGLGPGGRAEDGEVEDYLVSIETNPWQNPVLRQDVDGSGFVSPIDALLVIRRLTDVGAALPVPPTPDDSPPPYYDVNGSGFVSPIDILEVINYLNQSPASGEGEGAGFTGASADSRDALLALGPASVRPSSASLLGNSGEEEDTFLPNTDASGRSFDPLQVGTASDPFAWTDYGRDDLEETLDAIASDVDAQAEEEELWSDPFGDWV